MIIKRLLFCLIFVLLIFACGTGKNKKVYSLEEIRPFAKCDSLLPLIDIEDDNYKLKNINNLSYSTTYTSIYTDYKLKSDSTQKERIRYDYENRIHDLVTFAFPNIEITNDSVLLSKNYQSIAKPINKLHLKDNYYESYINYLITETNRSNKQLFIRVYSSHRKEKSNIYITFYVFRIKQKSKEILYEDRMRYNCDIRDYDSLEKVISYGLLKIKESFE